VSKDKKYVAVCEKSSLAMCTIYDIHSQKKVKVLPDQDLKCTDFEAKEFLSVCFNPMSSKAEGKQLITLTGEPDWLLILWNWDTLKILAKINIGISGVPFSINQRGGEQEQEFHFQVSYNPSEPGSVVVTGEDTYRYLSIEGNEFTQKHTQVNNRDRQMSTRYSCHAWMITGALIVCTEIGEIFMCEDGEFKNFIPGSPVDDNVEIVCVIPVQRGFVVAGNDRTNGYGKFYVYE
jgi:hypothetical protein